MQAWQGSFDRRTNATAAKLLNAWSARLARSQEADGMLNNRLHLVFDALLKSHMAARPSESEWTAVQCAACLLLFVAFPDIALAFGIVLSAILKSVPKNQE